MRPVKHRRRNLQRIENFVGNPAWDDFVAWCLHKRLTAVPANAWTLAAYIRSLEGTESLSKLHKRVADIGKAHAEKSKRRPERNPLIAKTFEIMEIRAREGAGRSKLFDDNDFTATDARPAKPKTGKAPPPDSAARPAKARVMRSTPKLVSKPRRK
ncbi:MAG: hypothetical protein HQ483_18510 [Rhodospirillales bacterium]|nr:hypothetical protein [Rhodospirillales bacterium]